MREVSAAAVEARETAFNEVVKDLGASVVKEKDAKKAKHITKKLLAV